MQPQHVLNFNTFTLLGIVFRFIQRPFSFYVYLSAMFNATYCHVRIERHELITTGIFLAHSITTIPPDIIDRFRCPFIAHASAISAGDATSLTRVISNVYFLPFLLNLSLFRNRCTISGVAYEDYYNLTFETVDLVTVTTTSVDLVTVTTTSRILLKDPTIDSDCDFPMMESWVDCVDVAIQRLEVITDCVTNSKPTFVKDPTSFLSNGGTPCCPFPGVGYQSGHLILDKFGFLPLHQLFLLPQLMMKWMLI